MEENRYCADQVKVAIPIRVRGMSNENRFFDEQTETDLVGQQSVVTHMRNLVDLDAEIHLISLKTNAGGTYRVLWLNTRETNGFHSVGLELLDSEGDLWAMSFPTPTPDVESAVPQVWLECQHCHQKLLTSVPEAQGEFLCEGFLVVRHCSQCKATRPWGITTEPESTSLEPQAAEAGPPPVKAAAPREGWPQEDLRGKGRAPIKMAIKVIRQKYGTTLEDIGTTVNVSRTGVYFLTERNYNVGEPVEVILPYKEGDVAIPVPGRVVRQDQPKGIFQRGVAIQLEKGSQ